MKRTLLLFLACASCTATNKAVIFSDGSKDSEVGWVCVKSEHPDRDWSCMDIRNFTQMLKNRTATEM
jgi:hypothetical protein